MHDTFIDGKTEIAGETIISFESAFDLMFLHKIFSHPF